MNTLHIAPEHEFEAQHGLPELLPADERILWQGSPRWQSLAVTAFHVRKVAIYFAAILALRATFTIADGGSLVDALLSVLLLAPLAVVALGLLALVARLSARTAVYTITNKRVVMRIGVVLSVTFNLPFASLDEASLKQYGDGTGDIPLHLAGQDRIAYLHLWPHVRPWRLARAEPMLRAVPDAARVAGILSRAMAGESAGRATEAATLVQPARPPRATGEWAAAS